jgi:hypothetical protein
MIAQDTLTAGTGGGGAAGFFDDGSAGSASGPDVSGSVTTSDHDLVGDGTGSNLSNGANGDQVGTSASPINPLLGPLQDNGGPTPTMALLPNSPAIDAGDSMASGLPSTDQRGYPRISGPAVDIGAYEVSDADRSVVSTSRASVTYGGTTTVTLQAEDNLGNKLTSGGQNVAFALGAGTSAGTFGPVTDHGNGTYTATFTATAVGTPVTITATINGLEVTTTLPTVTVTPAALTVTPTAGQSAVYGSGPSMLTYSASGLVNNDTISILSGALGTTSTAASPVGSYAFTLGTLSAGSNYTLTLAANAPNFAVTPATLTVTAENASRSYDAANPAFSYSITGYVNNDSASVVSGTPALSTTATASSAPGSYPITADVSSLSAANYTFQAVAGTLTVTPAALSATAADFTATAGAPFSGTVAAFTTSDKIDGAAAFTAVITWGDGSTSTGVVTGGNGSFTVSGSHTYAAAGSYAVSVQITNPNTQQITTNDPATVSSLNQGVTSGMTAGIGFWQNKNGQTLIDSFNGGPSAAALGSWLATCFPNLYGASAGSNCLAGKSNAQVAAYFQSLFSLGGNKVQAQVLAVALDVYATTSALGGNAGTAYGFSVSATGLGARSFSVGQDGAAFGVANNTTLTVYALLEAVNTKAAGGVLYGGNATFQAQAADLFNALSQAGSIG